MTMEAECIIEKWWRQLRPQSRGNIAGGLILLNHLRGNFVLDINAHKAERSDQLRGATAANVQKILAFFGEQRTLTKEGGRTNRGLVRNLTSLLAMMGESQFQNLSPEDRDAGLVSMQRFLAGKATDALNAPKIRFNYRSGMTSHDAISDILEQASKRDKKGDVAEYLVGAKLALRFPNLGIRNTAASAADAQSDEPGDFRIHDSVFHVTISPNAGHYEKCEGNLSDGMRVFLLVPDSVLESARGQLRLYPSMLGRVSAESIESFVSQNVEEMSEFSGDKIAKRMVMLIEKYNERLKEVDANLSLQIEVPPVLGGGKP